ncbi:MAG TPA: tetratricopeptide repeat protein [Gemmataceae bacterium]|nr:tetratricopeptide repeat protein [Gemmataceae bacterium]
MRVSWRLTLGILLAGLWPHLGCMHSHSAKDMQDQAKPITAKKEAPAPAPGNRAARAAELERAGNLVKAVEIYEEMRQPGSPDALLATKLLAGLYMRHNDLERAEQEYRTLLKSNPNDADVLSSLADISTRRGHWGTAERIYSEALRHQPEHASARSGLAMALAQQGAYDRSVAEYKKVLKSDADAQCEVAWVMKMQGKGREALQLYQTALSIDPGHARARNEVAMLRDKGITETPATIVRLTTPLAPAPTTSKTGIAELQPAPSIASEGMSRLQMQRPTLPPLEADPFANLDSLSPNQKK